MNRLYTIYDSNSRKYDRFDIIPLDLEKKKSEMY